MFGALAARRAIFRGCSLIEIGFCPNWGTLELVASFWSRKRGRTPVKRHEPVYTASMSTFAANLGCLSIPGRTSLMRNLNASHVEPVEGMAFQDQGSDSSDSGLADFEVAA